MEPLVRKRSGKVVPFSRFRIINAVYKAMKATKIGTKADAEKIADAVAVYLYRNYFKKGDVPHVETIQDIIEKTLMERGFPDVAKAYILYREKRRQAREIGKALVDGINLIEEYLGNEDWRVKENSNMSFSLQGLNFHVSSSIIARYWLEKLYPEEVSRAHKEGDFHIHDLGILGPYCVGWDLYDLLLKGFGGVSGKVESKPAKHFRSALGQIVNFFYTLQGECYSADTQVLTDKGWKYFWEVNKDDYIVTLNPETNEIELQKPVRFFEYDYDGELYHFKSKKLDLLVTPNHNMFVQQYCPKCKKGLYYRKFVKACEFNPNIHFIPKGGNWRGVKRDYFTLPGIKVFYYRHFLNPFKDLSSQAVISASEKSCKVLSNLHVALKYETVYIPELKIPMNDWLKFFGIWLAEGSVTLRERKTKERKKAYYEYQVRICQNKGKTAEEIEKLLKTLPFNYTKKEQGKKVEFTIYSKQLFLYLKQFGKAEDKSIPQEIKNLSKDQLEILFEWMMKGDGYIGNGNIDYYTKSKKLADDIQEIALKLGYSANVYEKRKGKFKWYRIAMSKAKYFKLSKENIKKVRYKGKVYCLEVPNHVLYVRRNGKACWCGNSAGAQAFSNFDTLLAPFIRYDKLSYQDVKQCMQEFLFNVNVPTRVGFQSLAWEEQVVIRRKSRIEVLPIGELVDSAFRENPHRIIPNIDSYGRPSKDSFMVPGDGDLEVLGWKDGKACWLKVKGLVRHRVPHKRFVKIRTGRGEVFISPAHSLFVMDNGKIKPVKPSELKPIGPNARIDRFSHVVGLKKVSSECFKNLSEIDLAEVIAGLPCEAKSKVYVHLTKESFQKLENNLKAQGKSIKQAVYELGYYDRTQYYEWRKKGMVPFTFWERYGDFEDENVFFSLRNYPEYKEPRKLFGERLKAFLTVLAFYITEGKAGGTNLSISQAETPYTEERIDELEKAFEILGVKSGEAEHFGWSSKDKKPTETKVKVFRLRGILSFIIKHTSGFSAKDKKIPYFVFDLNRSLREKFLSALIEGDGYYDATHRRFGFFSKSKRLIAGVSLLLASLGYHFVLSRKDPRTGVYGIFYYPDPKKSWSGEGDFVCVPVYEIWEEEYPHEWEYDLSVDCETENFVGGLGGVLFHNTPFTNLTFDLKPSQLYAKSNVIIGGKPRDEVYEEFHKEMSMINRAFCELMMEGDAKGRIFTFPIPTYNLTKDFDWDNPDYEPLWEMTRKYGIPYFANFVNSDMNPDDARSMCCRLRLDQRELRKRGGGLFGANPLTGSIGVVTINLPRIGYLSTCEEELFERLETLMELAKTSLEIKRKVIEDFTERGLYPYSRFYLQSVKEARGQYWANHFSTIGVVGMNEMCLNFVGKPIYDPSAKEFAIKVLRFMRDKIADFQEETGNLYNLEATPAEGTSYRLAKIDKKKFPRIKTSGTDQAPYYTNSCHLPVNYTDDIFEILTHQDDLQVLFTGGTVVHLFVGEEITDRQIVKELIKTIVENFRLPYFSITPTFSVCPVHGYLPGKHEFCPYPHTEEELEKFGIEVELPITLLTKLPEKAYKEV